METLRDTALGKLVRLFSRYRLMQYPEEQDRPLWPEYLKTEGRPKDEDLAAPATAQANQEGLEVFGLYTVLSQVSTRLDVYPA